jgi:hypothetical protein
MSAEPRRVIPFPGREFSTPPAYIPNLASSYPHAANGGADDERHRDLDLSSPPSSPDISTPRFSTGASRAQLDGLAYELHALGLHGAYNYVRRHRFDHVRAAWSEVVQSIQRGDDIINPPGFLRWLVAEAERARGVTE